MKTILRALRDDRGATSIEYGVFAAFAAVVALSGLSAVGGKINGVFATAGQAMAASTPADNATVAEATRVAVGDTRDQFLENHQ